jgi:biopolymer transport protein ExbB
MRGIFDRAYGMGGIVSHYDARRMLCLFPGAESSARGKDRFDSETIAKATSLQGDTRVRTRRAMQQQKMKQIIIAVAAAVLMTNSACAQERPAQPSNLAAPAAEVPSAPAADAPQVAPAPPAAGDEAKSPAKPTALPLHELSPWSMFLSADPLVKAVMLSLVFASLVTWTIFFARSLAMRLAQWRLRRSLAKVSAAKTLAEAQMMMGRTRNVVSAMVAAAVHEIGASAGLANEQGIKERVASTFSELARAESRAARQGMGLLATIGATAPFVGLFGTVWGIMNSFIGISKSQTTNLAVVAPGIAEALLATAFGLAAAIPAVIIFNYFARSTRGYLDLVAKASGTVGRLLSRDLDRMGERAYPRAAE